MRIAKVKSIKLVGKRDVFDITTASHNFIANDIVVHNSMWTPMMAGSLALLLSAKPDMPRDRGYLEELISRSTKFPHPIDPITGWGVFDVPKALGAIEQARVKFLSSIKDIVNMALMPLAMLAPKPPEALRTSEVRIPAFTLEQLVK